MSVLLSGRLLLFSVLALLTTLGSVRADPVVHIAPGGDDLAGDGSAGNPYRSLQRGVDAVDPGGLVLVADGDYQGFAIVSKPLSVVALGPGRPRIGVGSGSGALFAVVATADVVVQGVEWVGALGRTGCTAFGPVDRLRFVDCGFTGFPNVAVELLGGTSVGVGFEDCVFDAAGRGAGGSAVAVFAIGTDALRFERCRFVDGDFGMRMLGAMNTQCIDCEFVDMRQAALTAVFCADLLLDRCLVRRCAQLPSPSDWAAPMDGLAAVSLVAMCDRALLRDTVIEDCGGYLGGGGFQMAGGSFDGLFGLAIEDSVGWRLVDCSLHRNDYGGLLVDGVASSGVLERCNLVGNGRYAALVGSTDRAIHSEGTVDARGCFFGAVAGPVADGVGPGNDVGGPGMVLTTPVAAVPFEARGERVRSMAGLASLPAPGRPVALAAGDFDGDDRDDLVAAEDLGRALVLHLRTGPGVFAAPLVVPLGFAPRDLLAADLDGDGDLDVAVLDEAGDRLVSWLGDGTGGLQAGPVVALPRRPNRLCAVDADGVAPVELAVACLGDPFGSGGLALVRGLATSELLAGIASPVAVVALDVDRDGAQDLVAYELSTSTGGQGLRVHAGDGLGSFAAGVAVGAADPGPVADASLAVGDVDGDAASDLVVARFALFPLPGGTVVEARAVGAAATGGLGPATLLRAVSGPVPLAIDRLAGPGQPASVLLGLPVEESALWLGAVAGGEAVYAERVARQAPPLAVATGEFDDSPGRDVVFGDARSGTLSVRRGRREGSVTGYGVGCTGSLGYPSWRPRSAPELGSRTFGLFLENVPAGSSAFLFFGILPGDVPLPGGCSMLVSFPFTVALVTNAQGRGVLPLPIPDDPALLRGSVFAQWVVVDPQGQALGAISASQGFEVRLGG